MVTMRKSLNILLPNKTDSTDAKSSATDYRVGHKNVELAGAI
jgi:hypothetical protein